MKYALLFLFAPGILLSQINQINPLGPAFNQFSDAYRFPDGSAMLATGGPFVVKVDDLNEAEWQYGKHKVIYTDSFNVRDFEVLTPQIWSVGPYFTRDGGKTFSYMRSPSDSLSFFLNGQDWAIIDVNEGLHISSDAGASWQQMGGIGWHMLNRSDTTLMFLRYSDTTLHQFHSDTLHYICHWPEIYPGLQDITWFHQVDTNLFVFEQQYRPFFYQTTADSTWLDQNNFFTAPPTRIFVEGRRVIRQTATGTFDIFNNNTGGWARTTVGYNGPAFAFSNNYLFYNSYLPDTTYAEGNLGIFRLGGGDETLLGYNAYPHSTKVYATADANSLYGVGCCRFDGSGVLVDSSAHQGIKHIAVNPNEPKEYGIGNKALYSSTNHGDSWTQEKSVTDFMNSSTGGDFLDMQFTTDGKSLKVYILDTQGQQHLGNYDLSTGSATSRFIDQALPFALAGERMEDFAFKDSQTGVAIVQGLPVYTNDGGQSFQVSSGIDSSTVFYSVKHFDNEFIASGQDGIWRSTGGSSWTLSPNTSFDAKIQVVLNENTFLALSGYHLVLTNDGGQNTRKILLPFSQLSHIDKLSSNSVVMSGNGGQLYLVANADQMNVSDKEISDAPKVMSYFPNPAREFFNLNFAEELEVEIAIYTMEGREAFRKKLEKTRRAKIPLTALKPGLYAVQVHLQGRVESFQLIVL